MPKKPHQQETFCDMCHEMQTGTPKGSDAKQPYTSGSWGKKAKHSFRYSYTGNEGQACQLPLTTRKENVLAAIEKKTETGIWVKVIEPTVLKALLDDGSVYLNRSNSLFGRPTGRFYTRAVSLKFPQPDKEARERRREENKRRLLEARLDAEMQKEDTGPKRTIKWTKDKEQKLMMDMLKGKADPKIVKQLTRTKTKPKKITK